MLRTNRRKTVLTTAALIATTALLTSCGGSDSDSGDQKSNGSASSSKDVKGSTDKSGAGEGRDGVDDTKKQAGREAGGKGVSGTWFGTVSYLAPGKYTVSDMKDREQAFFTSTSTDIQGTGDICGDAGGQAAQKCSEAELEAAAKKGVSAKVEIKDGTAVSIIDDH
ncbi:MULTISPECIES: hypothetical protein [Streptomyces]|uniref:DUF5666 domain-containing protein n=1 Tax=Streptomyces lycii TaxID=2654337 RepID=A0ABQ7FJF9_9ACTN|nr:MULTISPECIES: hypothetical protein [Streptomyces]KAF4408767.1 hypothetical protein GCU69_12675 [Streptomyces lycii]